MTIPVPVWMSVSDEVDRGNQLGAADVALRRIGREFGPVFEQREQREEALAAAREVGILVVPVVDQLLPEVGGPLELLRQADREGWRVMMLSVGIDSSAGFDFAKMMLSGGELPPGTLPIPKGPFDTPVAPAEMRRRVSVGTEETFLTSGALHVECYDACLRAADAPLAESTDLLEWGAGCGRMTIHLLNKASEAHLTAADTDTDTIGWVGDNLPVAAAVTLPVLPPSDLADDAFDRVVGHSIFTHLELEAQDAWLSELARVTQPGGMLALSIHGPLALKWHLRHPLAEVPESIGEETEREGFAVWREDGWEDHFYDGYHTTFHTHEYVRDHWSRWFDVVAIHEGAATPTQDIVILQAR
jgi:ubiquinone/menaquinone biosynthesis C-methylase UbiE